MPDSNGNEIATMYVGHNGIAPQAEGETNHSFRARVSARLREEGMIVDAHEVYTNKYHDEKVDDYLDSPTTGIAGACALAMQGQESRDLGHDMAAGVYIRKPKPSAGYEDALLMLAMALGGR